MVADAHPVREDEGQPRRGGLPALVRRAGGLLRRDRLTAIVDQGVLAAARIAALVIFARIMPTESFGAFSLVVSIGFLLNNQQRAVVVLPFIVACRRAEDTEQAVRAWTWIDLATTVLVALVLAAGWAACLALDADPWIATALGVSALSTPFLMAFTFLRRVGYQTNRHRAVLVMVIVHAVAYVAGIAAAWVLRDIPSLPFLVPVVAPAAGALVGAVAMRGHLSRPPAGLWRTFRASLEFTRWSFLANLAASVNGSGMNLIVGGMMGAAGSAVFSATRTLVTPVASVNTANDMVDKPRAGRAFAAKGHAGLHRSARNTMVFLLALGGPYLALVAIFAGPILDLVYGTKYGHLETELRLWALVMALTLVTNPFATYLVTLRDTKTIFLCNLAGAAVTLGVALPLIGSYGVMAALAGMGAGRLATVTLLALAARRSHRNGSDSAEPPPDAGGEL